MQSAEDAIVMHVLYTKHGWSISELAREFGVSWRTAKRYATAETPPRYATRLGSAELSEAQLAHVRRRLAVCPTLRSTTLLRELVDLGYKGSADSLRRRVRLMRPETEHDPEARFETGPGVQVQVDWAHCGLWLVGSELVELKALVAVLGFSRMVAARFAIDTTRETTLRLLVRLLDDLGGAGKQVLTDRDPAFVIGSTPKGLAVFAPEWIDLAELLGVTPRACKPYRAKTKGKVERVIRELKEDFLAWLTGQPLSPATGLADYDRLARRWAMDVVATRTHRTTKRVVSDAWAEERALLRPVPERVLVSVQGDSIAPATLPNNVIHLNALREQGSVVEQRPLLDYEEAST